MRGRQFAHATTGVPTPSKIAVTSAGVFAAISCPI